MRPKRVVFKDVPAGQMDQWLAWVRETYRPNGIQKVSASMFGCVWWRFWYE